MQKYIKVFIVAIIGIMLMISMVSAIDFKVFQGDQQCPAGYTLATPQDARANQSATCNALDQWSIARLAGGGSMDGPGYQCKIRDDDKRSLRHSLCKKFSKESFQVTSLPGLSVDVGYRQYAGLLPVNTATNSHLFFWLLEAKNNPETAPLVVWLNGGAGCSSMLGLFLENGPYRVQDNLTLALDPHYWNQNANILYLDQPAGAGFSYTDQKPDVLTPDQIQAQIGIDFYAFLKQFLSIFPEYKARELFISGESFAGNYIPHMATYILEQNKTNNDLKINLKGLMLLVSWVYPAYHYGSYADYSYSLGIIGEGFKREVEKVFQICKAGLDQGRTCDAFENDDPACACYQIRPMIHEVSGYGSYRLNNEDVRTYVEYDENTMPIDYPKGIEGIAPYLRQSGVVQAIHATATPHQWKDCRLLPDLQRIINNPTQKLLPNLLAHMPMVFINGQFDFVINPVGTERYLYNLKWPHQQAYQKAGRFTWPYEGKPAGYAKSYGNMTFVVALGAGHWLPMDAPGPALDAFNRFITGKGFK